MNNINRELEEMFAAVLGPQTIPLEVEDTITGPDLDAHGTRLWYQDYAERKYREQGFSHVVLFKGQKTKKWTVQCFLIPVKEKASSDPMAGIFGSAPSAPQAVSLEFNDFEEAEAWVSKNKYFHCKETKYYYNAFASWDKK